MNLHTARPDIHHTSLRTNGGVLCQPQFSVHAEHVEAFFRRLSKRSSMIERYTHVTLLHHNLPIPGFLAQCLEEVNQGLP
jgi:hypothetical protein